MSVDLAIANGTVVSPGGVRLGTVLVSDGRIAGVLAPGVPFEAGQTVDAAGLHVLPGGVEPHTHLGVYLGYENDLETETKSAAAGGVTTVFHFLTTVGSYRDVLDDHIGAIDGRACVDVAFNGVINGPQHLDEIEYLMENGITSFKFFMAYKGEEGKAISMFGSDEATLAAGFEKIGHLGGLPMVHAENQGIYLGFTPRFKDRTDLAAFSEARPEIAEDLDIRTACRLAEFTSSPLYIVHLAYGNGIDIVNEFRRRGVEVFLETCPHYLTADKSGDGLEEPVSIKVMPPVKGKDSAARLWEGLGAGEIDTIGTDHCANIWEKKRGQGDIWTAMAGFPGMATRLPLVLSEGVNRGRITIEQAVDALSTKPAKVLGLYPRKGAIVTGGDADLVLVDLDLEEAVQPEKLQSASDYSPWQGWVLKGWPVKTILRGKTVMERGQVFKAKGCGEFVRTVVPSGR